MAYRRRRADALPLEKAPLPEPSASRPCDAPGCWDGFLEDAHCCNTWGYYGQCSTCDRDARRGGAHPCPVCKGTGKVEGLYLDNLVPQGPPELSDPWLEWGVYNKWLWEGLT